MSDNKFKNVLLGVLLVGLISMTIAFAALTQTLVINDNQVSLDINWRVRFNQTVTTSVGTTLSGSTTGASVTANTPTVTNDRQAITGLRATFTKPGDYVEVAFTVQNEGNIAVEGTATNTIVLGSLTCAPASGSTASQADVNTFCSKLTSWVKHSDRVTDFSSSDYLSAYSGSGLYPSIDGILRIEMPSTLTNADMAVVLNGGVVVTLGDTSLHFIQSDGSGNQSGGNQSGGNEGGNQSGGNNQQEETGNFIYQQWSGWVDSLSSLDSGYNAYLRKNTDTNEESVCTTYSGGEGCIQKHAFDCTLTYNNSTETYECNDTSSFIYQKKTELESKGATCRFSDHSGDSVMNCIQNNGNQGCQIWSSGYYLSFDDSTGAACYMWDNSSSYCE